MNNFKEPSYHLSGGSEENYKILCQDSQSSGQDSNPELSKYKS